MATGNQFIIGAIIVGLIVLIIAFIARDIIKDIFFGLSEQEKAEQAAKIKSQQDELKRQQDELARLAEEKRLRDLLNSPGSNSPPLGSTLLLPINSPPLGNTLPPPSSENTLPPQGSVSPPLGSESTLTPPTTQVVPLPPPPPPVEKTYSYTEIANKIGRNLTCVGKAVLPNTDPNSYCIVKLSDAPSICQSLPNCGGYSVTQNANHLAAYPDSAQLYHKDFPLDDNPDWTSYQQIYA